MPAHVTAIEIIKQSVQGVSVKPFLVKADDNQTYFVKGLSRALAPGLTSELLASELGSHLGLPIPPWAIMEIPQKLIDFSLVENVRDLEGGPAFASLQVDNALDVSWSQVEKIPTDLKKKVLLFDWWIGNGDRGLGPAGGNVNLILDNGGNLAVIDHNIAFDSDLDPNEFRRYHVFREQLSAKTGELLARLEFLPMLDAALADWDRITSLLPEEWVRRDFGHGEEYEPTLAERYQLLERFKDEQFWGQL
ncbi:HipA family kinase [Pseudomonas syringae]|uniref:HipA family kinase n=1 Tax=Pseudomonas syringae TaxID=317 RepID=UPI003F75047E